MSVEVSLPSAKGFFKGKFTFLFFSFVLLFLLSPFTQDKTFLLKALFTLLIFSSVYAVSNKRKLWVIALCFVIPDVFLTWGTILFWKKELTYLGLSYINIFHVDLIWRTLFLIFVAVNVLIRIMRTRQVTTDTIFGAFCVYFFMAIIWSQIYVLMESLSPASFAFHHQPELSGTPGQIIGTIGLNFLYYSFVTLTTLGYGDITPISLHAKSFAAFEAVAGQLYLAVLVARLVGLHISGSKKQDT